MLGKSQLSHLHSTERSTGDNLMASSGRLTVYLETSLDTRLILAISSDDTAASLKKKIVAEHLALFPAMGEIIVQAVKTCFKGMMFTITNSVPVSTLHNAINETVLLYVEAVAANHENHLRNEKVDEGLKVPIGGIIEDSMLIEPPHDKETLPDPLHDLAGASASVLHKSEKKRHKKSKPSGDISVRSTEFRKSEDEGFEGNFVQEELGHMTSKQEKKVNIQANNTADSNIVNFGVEHQSANGDESKKDESGKGEQLCIEGGDLGVVFGGRKKRKKNKAAFPEVLTQELSYRENESCKENASKPVLEKEKSEVETADFINQARKERSRKKSKKTKASSSDIPYEVLPFGENHSEKTGDKVHKSHQIAEKQSDSGILQKSVAVGESAEAYTSDRQLDKERLEPEINLPAENDIQSHNHHEIQQQADMPDITEESGKDTKIIKETAHVIGGDAGVYSLEKKRRKKKKATSIEGLAHETAANESGQEKGSDLILEKEIVKDVVDAGLNKIAAGTDLGVVSVEKRRHKKSKAAFSGGLSQKPSTEEAGSCKGRESNLNLDKEPSNKTENAISLPGGDHEVAAKEKRKRKKNNVASTDLPLQEQLENGSSKAGGDHLMLEKETHCEADNAHVTKNADDAPLSDPKSTELEDPMRVVSEILADLNKRSPIISDGQIDIAPPIIDNEIESREIFGLASSQKDGTRNQTLDLNKIEDSIGGGKEKKRREQEATNSGAKVAIDGASYEANGSIKNSLSRTDSGIEKEPQTKFQKALVEDDVAARLSSVDKKSFKGKSKEKRVTDKLSDTSVADGTTQNAPSTPDKVQKSGDYIGVEIRDKEASSEAVQTKGSEDFHAPAREKIKFMDYFSHKDSDQPTDVISAPLKETKGNKKTQNSFSKDSTSDSVDTRVSAKSKRIRTTKKPVKSSKEHNPNETINDTSGVHTTMDDDVSKGDGKMKSLLADMAVTSDASTEDEEVVGSQMRRPMVAVRKVASKAIGKEMDASRKISAVFSSGGLDDYVAINASARDESESVVRGSPMPKKKEGRAMMSPSSTWEDEQLTDDYVPMSQESTRPKKNVNLSSILKSSTSYKKAKISASQSQAEDREMIDMVFETQPDLV